VKLILFLLGVALVATAFGRPVDTVAKATASAGSAGRVLVVQALPGASVDLAVDGTVVKKQVRVGAMVGPLSLSSGSHELEFSGAPRGTVRTSVTVRPGSSSDVVLHRPASVDGDPVVNTYQTPLAPIGPGKARIFLAHTATVAPADAAFDGKVVFTNIANGEYADADVPAGPHRVALLPTGTTDDPILGPLDVTLAPRTATMVYAVGNPHSGSMNVIVHTVRLASDGSAAPRSMDTGSAGLVDGVRVVPFTASAAD
jgi:Domain of unknown function (DUF4397)